MRREELADELAKFRLELQEVLQYTSDIKTLLLAPPAEKVPPFLKPKPEVRTLIRVPSGLTTAVAFYARERSVSVDAVLQEAIQAYIPRDVVKAATRASLDSRIRTLEKKWGDAAGGEANRIREELVELRCVRDALEL